ncbi:MAG: CBS domain-containing protein [Halobacteriota archaeon]
MRYDNYSFTTASDLASAAYAIDKSDRISHALDLMEKHRVNQLLVMNEGELVGLLTKQGIARTLGASGDTIKPASSLHVTKAMDDTFTVISGALSIGEVNHLMESSEVLIVVNEQPARWITFNEIVKASRPGGFAGEIMDPPSTCSPFDRVTHTRRRMIDENAWWMVVVEDNKLVGIVTENDIAKAMSQFRDIVKSHYQDSRVRKLLVDDIMITDIVFARTNTPCVEVVDFMVKHDVEGVPVLDLTDTMVGVITQSTVLRKLE